MAGGLHRAKQERTDDTHAFEHLTDDSGPQRVDVGRDVRQFEHVSAILPLGANGDETVFERCEGHPDARRSGGAALSG